jgi:glycosyltransferase involved in cell wall biosynthesis
MAKVVFYCRDEREHLNTFEYYQQDIEALRALGHDVIVCTRYREIPRKFDAIYIWWWTYALWPVLLAKVMRKPTIITGVFNLRFPSTLKGRDYFHRPLWQRLLIASATRLCSLNLFIDAAEFRGCAEHFGLTNARHLSCSIHEDYLRGSTSSRRLAIFNLAWSGRGNLVRKGVPELLEAVALLKADGIEVAVTLAGPRGDGTEYLLGRIKELGLEKQIAYLGPLERGRKIELLRSHEIYAQPSHHEGFGLATAEAMGCGACVITCDVGAVRSVVGDCGIYVKPGDARDLAKGIKRALSDAPLRDRLQKAAHERAKAELAPEKKREKLQHLLSEVGIE